MEIFSLEVALFGKKNFLEHYVSLNAKIEIMNQAAKTKESNFLAHVKKTKELFNLWIKSGAEY